MDWTYLALCKAGAKRNNERCYGHVRDMWTGLIWPWSHEKIMKNDKFTLETCGYRKLVIHHFKKEISTCFEYIFGLILECVA